MKTASVHFTSRTWLFACLLLILLFRVSNSFAQYENVWIFGHNAGLDFNGPVPVSITSNLSTGVQVFGEANASVCSPAGTLLFYTEGTRVLDRQHQPMPNGSNLLPFSGVTAFTPTSSTSQGALIVPVPGSSSRYYIFSLTAHEESTANNWGKLFYSIVDMSLNGGYGDVVVGEKGIALDTDLSERMTAVAGSCNNVWLLTVTQDNKLKVREITAAGINPAPVFTTIPWLNAADFDGCIAISPDKTKIAITQGEQGLNINGLILCDFDRATGTASNARQLNPATGGYGVCFSPDNSKLYFNQTGSGIYQFNLAAGSLADIINSKVQLSNPVFTHLKLAPNGKIYFQGSYSGSAFDRMSVINQPDMPGMACAPQSDAVTLQLGTGIWLGLPNSIVIAKKDTVTSFTNHTACAQQLTLNPADASGWDYTWNDGFTGTSRTVGVNGVCWVKYNTMCAYHIDTFYVNMQAPLQTKITKVICNNETFDFNGRALQTAGAYTEIFQAANGCDSVVLLDLIVLPAAAVSIAIDHQPALCVGDSVLCQAAGTVSYQWFQNGVAAGLGASVYIPLPDLSNNILVVGLSENNCRDSARLTIPANSCCELFVPNAFSPNGDGRNDRFGAESPGNFYKYQLFIYNRWGERVYQSFNIHDKWDGTYRETPMETGTYFYQVKVQCQEGKELLRKGDVTLIR